MNKRRQAEGPGPGNDGAWFLDMVGVDRHQVIAATLNSDFDMPSLPHSTSTETTSELVGRAWQATVTQDPLADWVPHELAKQVTSGRNYRWTVVVTMLVIGAGLLALILWLPSIVQNRADARAEEYRSVTSDLRSELPSAQDALATATDPAATTEEISAQLGPLTALASAADRLSDAIDEPLPEPLPLLPSGPINDLVPLQDRLGPLGGAATSVQERITDLVLYRTLLAGITELPGLPVGGSVGDINELRVELATFHADGVGALNQMSPDPALEEHLEEVRAALDQYADWQIDYLEAIRQGDDAGPLVTEITTVFENLEHTIVAPLAEIRTETDAQILDLAQKLDDALLLLPS